MPSPSRPPAATLALFGDKTKARALARRAGVPLLPGADDGAVSLDEVSAYGRRRVDATRPRC
jgi:biotin carboxylase